MEQQETNKELENPENQWHEDSKWQHDLYPNTDTEIILKYYFLSPFLLQK